jgi:hypothetical protein
MDVSEGGVLGRGLAERLHRLILPAPAIGGHAVEIRGEALGHDRLGGRPGVRRLAGEQLVEHAAEAVEVGAAAERRVGEEPLRAHVGRRAEDEAGSR